MKIRRIKYLMFNYVIAVLEFLHVYVLKDIVSDYYEKIYKDYQICIEKLIQTDYIIFFIISIILITLICLGKFIIFKKKALKNNLINLVKLLLSFLWNLFFIGWSYCISISHNLDIAHGLKPFSAKDDLIASNNFKFSIFLCVFCIIYIIWGEKIHNLFYTLKQKIKSHHCN